MSNIKYRAFRLVKPLLVALSILLCVAGMFYVSFTFPFFSDEHHLFADSLWSVDAKSLGIDLRINSIYNDYFKNHYPERVGHPNGVVLILGSLIWILHFLRELSPENIMFFVLSIRFFLICVFLFSLYLVYLFIKECDHKLGKDIGLATVAISSIFPPLVAYGSIRAMDTLSLLFLILTLWSFARLIRLQYPSLLYWILPGISSGVFIILKKSGVLIIPLLFIYAILFSVEGMRFKDWKRLIITFAIAAAVVVITNNPLLFVQELFWPTTELHNLTGSPGIRKFGLMEFQIAKFWAFINPDYYYYLGYYRHASPLTKFMAVVNKYFTTSFFILYLISCLTLIIMKRWKILFIFNIPWILLLLSLPEFKAYRFVPVFPLLLASIASVLAILWQNYPEFRYRLITAIAVLILFFVFPISSFFSRQEVAQETYLDLGEIAAENRKLNFSRNIFFDRNLYRWTADWLISPFALIPNNDGLLKEKISFQGEGEYWINLLIATEKNHTSLTPQIMVQLKDQSRWIDTTPGILKWYEIGPFSIGPDELDQLLVIYFKGINIEGNVNAIALHDILIADSNTMSSIRNDHYGLPKPWWFPKR